MSNPHPRRLTSIPREVDDHVISKYVRFAPDSGQILLFDQRMLLMHGFTLAALRQELIERLGLERTRELFTRLGYQQGMEDARRLHASEKGELERILAYGPRLREMEGFVRNHLAGAQLHPRTTKILVRDFPLGLLEPGSPHHAKIQPLFAELGDLLLAIMQRGQADGSIIARAPQALALLLRSTTVGLSRLLLLLGAGRPSECMEELLACCRRAFAAR